MNEISTEKPYYLMCERKWIFYTLMIVGGFLGAYTYVLKGHVFCNAQTGNIVLMGMALGSGEIKKGLFYLIPLAAYILGSFMSEILPNPIKYRSAIRWDTLLIGIEIATVIAIGFIPDSAPVQISQIMINFIASMQYNTFRQAEGVPMATTFATNHVRQIGITIAKKVKHRDRDADPYNIKIGKHLLMLMFFLGGATFGTFMCHVLSGRAIWITVIPFGIVFCALLYADLVTEKDMVHRKPLGH